MPLSNPAKYKNPSWQRTVLLASDCKHSVLAESVEGQHNLIAYSAYGDRNARQIPMTQTGFNAELRESKSGWYFLGNGYRAYNPRLMRFHSPDTFSPFGKGGLNAYMYCGGEPVTRSDPSGQGFLRKAEIGFQFFFGGSGMGSRAGGRHSAITGSTSGNGDGLLDVFVALNDRIHSEKRPAEARSGGKGRRHAKPSWKYQQFSGSASGAAPAAPQAVADNTVQNSALSGNSSGSSSSSSSSSRYSSRSSSATPSTVSTISSLSFTSNDSGNSSQHSGASGGSNSGNSEIRGRLENLRR